MYIIVHNINKDYFTAQFVCVSVCTCAVLKFKLVMYVCACFSLAKPTCIALIIFLVAADWLSACFLHIHDAYIYMFSLVCGIVDGIGFMIK